jgi:hypothetical protein
MNGARRRLLPTWRNPLSPAGYHSRKATGTKTAPVVCRTGRWRGGAGLVLSVRETLCRLGPRLRPVSCDGMNRSRACPRSWE